MKELKTAIEHFLQYAEWYKQNANIDQINQIIALWQSVDAYVEMTKSIEIKLRNLVVDIMFRNHQNDESKTIDLGGGYRLRGTFKTNFSLNKDTKAINEVWQKLSLFGLAGTQAYQSAIRSEPKFSKTEYDKLPEQFKTIINELLETSPGTPQLKLLKPGEK